MAKVGTCCIICLFCAAAVIAAPAQSVYFTTLMSFNGANGADPSGTLIQANDGNFYGTTAAGGNQNWPCGFDGSCGTVFRITPGGRLTTLYSFCPQYGCVDGYAPYGALVQATDGNFYGTTTGGGANERGTVFKITASGALTTLYSFCSSQPVCADGADPYAGLVQGTDGVFYGTTRDGGGTSCVDCGTVFKITPEGTLTTLHSFDGSDGIGPSSGLIASQRREPLWNNLLWRARQRWHRFQNHPGGRANHATQLLPILGRLGDLWLLWCKPVTGTSTAQPRTAGTTMGAPRSK